jgi:predicted glycosyl hydrolase (DUF1957 family)
MNIEKILEDSDKFINVFSDKTEKRILTAIRGLELRIIDLAKELPTVKSSLKYDLKQAQAFHANILKEFNEVYNENVSEIISEFSKIETFVISELSALKLFEDFSKADKLMFTALKSQLETSFVHLGTSISDKMIQAVYDKVISGGKFSELIDNFRGLLTGSVTQSGRTLSSYAQTYANDSVNGYYAQIHKKKATEAGLTDFLYYGNIMKDSREWCIKHVGKTYTLAEVKSFETQSWQGKKPGDIFIVRGGYNCRHQFRAVKKEWLS